MENGLLESEKIGVDESGSYRRSVSITINCAALRENLATARRLSGNSRLFATIKADAYGHGAIAVAQALSPPVTRPVLQNECLPVPHSTADGVADGFAVVTLGEALALRESGIQLPILVLQGPQNTKALKDMQRYGLWPVIHDIYQYGWFCQYTERDQLAPWLKVDTGMGRLGFQPEEASAMLADHDTGVKWAGLMTHFACADDTRNPLTEQQIECFHSVESDRQMPRSLANSAAVLAWPQSRADWARPGIMLYGCNPLDRALEQGVELTPVMTVQAPLISVKMMKKGAGIGYAQHWICPEDMPVGYVAAGYRDGIPRVLDESACVSIAGRRCSIIGRVSMDSFAVDLRALPHVKPGERVELWGEEVSVDHLAKAAGTISYELLTSIRGERGYIGDDYR